MLRKNILKLKAPEGLHELRIDKEENPVVDERESLVK